jgi:tRNA/rRNA methyltransferase
VQPPGLDLSRIRVVLCEPLYGGNIGQVARAMVNFGLSRLVLVAPREHLTPEAYWMAREGKGVLEGAAIHPTLEAALAEVGLAVATTRRVGKYRRPAITPEEFANDVAPLTAGNDVAVVFGREDSGLTQTELGLCQWLVTIPASESFPSLNLAQAVLLMGYVLFRRSREATEATETAQLRLAGPAELERFYGHLHQTLEAIGFLTGDHAPSIFMTLRRIFGRANLESRDVAILRGILGQMDWYRENASVPVLLVEKERQRRERAEGGTSQEKDGPAAAPDAGREAQNGARRAPGAEPAGDPRNDITGDEAAQRAIPPKRDA